MVGVTTTGFETKSLDDIVNEINSSLVAAIGAGFDTALDTPQGQIVNVISDAQSTMWELLQGVYSSIDLRQATGNRLDQLGQFRNLPRILNESDELYRARLLSPIDPTRTAIGKLQAAISNVTNVESVLVYYNDSGVKSNSNLQPLTVSLVVKGGDDATVAQAINDNLIFGLGLIGNTTVHVNDDGLCRTINFTRATTTQLSIQVTTKISESFGVCGGTNANTIKDLLIKTFKERLNQPGQLISIDFLKAVLICEGIGIQELTINNKDKDVHLIYSEFAGITSDNIAITVGG